MAITTTSHFPSTTDRCATAHAHPATSTQTAPAAADPPALLAAVADPTRWQILHLLRTEELCTTHLQDLLGLKQNLVSHHLRVLREAGLVLTAPCGRFTYYRLNADTLDALGRALATLAEAAHRPPSRRAC